MASVKLYLKEPNSTKKSLIYLVVHINGKRIKISTGEFINPKDWNSEKEKVNSTHSDTMEINHSLTSMKDEMKSIIRKRIILKKNLDINEIKDEFSSIYQKKNITNANFFDHYEQFITNQKSLVTPGTIRNYRSTFSRLKDFNEEFKFKLSFDKINHNFYSKFLKYLFYDLGFLTNTAGRHIKTLKTFMNYATKRGINQNLEYKDFKKLEIDVDKISLDEDEINAIINVDLSQRQELKQYRDQFILQCYTGMRYSDLMNFKPENVYDDYIIFRTLKTHEEVKISITKPIRSILKNIPNYEIIKISVQKLNMHLKELGRIAGIDKSTLQVNYKGSLRVEKIVPKHELITTHTARRTFITIADKNHVRHSVIKRITGIKDDRTLRKYIKVDDKDIAFEMNKMWGGNGIS